MRTHDGALLSESLVVHVYSRRGGLVARIDVEESGGGASHGLE
ncbi:MAG TPA: hypothetical protein VLW51_07760 [Solirubrobacteraceae bacterium]|nr:hypothetical protein [Solirubrobacteraceae bacterium]